LTTVSDARQNAGGGAAHDGAMALDSVFLDSVPPDGVALGSAAPVVGGGASAPADAAGDDVRTAPLLAAVLPSPAGPLAVLLTPDGVVRAAGFAPVPAMLARLPLDLAARGHELLDAQELRSRGGGAAVVAESAARYADGEVGALDAVAVAQPGGPFQQRAWAAMRAIAPGATATYAELALAAGSPAAVRAAGSACARNLVAPFVPCHRVLRSGGTLGGYYYGLEVKQALLAHEARG
jgi:methylated-DNA-[protein]-cysteine S-methyltransferase